MLPKIVDPRRSAEQGISYREAVSLDDLPRINEFASSVSPIDVELDFSRDEQYRIRVIGRVKGQVQLQCQRCMGDVDTDFDQQINLMVVWNDEQSKAVPRDIDPWEVDEQANLYELIEDEILLALPVVARHPEGQCEAPEIPNQVEIEPEEGRQKPFEILKALTKGSD